MPRPGSAKSLEESMEEWRAAYPYSCRTTCPGALAFGHGVFLLLINSTFSLTLGVL